jgi:hypothetical protein
MLEGSIVSSLSGRAGPKISLKHVNRKKRNSLISPVHFPPSRGQIHKFIRDAHRPSIMILRISTFRGPLRQSLRHYSSAPPSLPLEGLRYSPPEHSNSQSM